LSGYTGFRTHSETIMQDILTFFIARERLRHAASTHPADAEQAFYDTAAPVARTVHAVRQQLARWRQRRSTQQASGG
jgi:hypothetical protein